MQLSVYIKPGLHLQWSFSLMRVLLWAGSLFGISDTGMSYAQTPNQRTPPLPVEVWMTRGDQSVLLQQQSKNLAAAPAGKQYPTLIIDTTKTFQAIEGFGYALTGGSATVLHQLPDAQRTALLREIFGNGEGQLGVSYIRISIGASDLDAAVFSYDDLPAGKTDTALAYFSLKPDSAHLLPVLKEIVAIRPDIKIMASPWSAPVWMKSNGNSIGGSLLPQYYGVYARYFVKYIQQMKAHGIAIDAITPQNEPLHPGNNPSMYMTALEQAEFIKNQLGPAFQANGLSTKIIIYDHNCNKPEYPLAILNDPDARKYVAGSAFHLYEGDISALTAVHSLHPDKTLYFTEQWTGAKGSFEEDLLWHLKNVVIGSIRNWSKVVLEWNLASDGEYNPHTPGGCTECKGALTLGEGVLRNVSYYIIGHAAKFIPPGSIRIASSLPEHLTNVALLTPQGKKVLIVVNDKNEARSFTINLNGHAWVTELPAATVATYIW